MAGLPAEAGPVQGTPGSEGAPRPEGGDGGPGRGGRSGPRGCWRAAGLGPGRDLMLSAGSAARSGRGPAACRPASRAERFVSRVRGLVAVAREPWSLACPTGHDFVQASRLVAHERRSVDKGAPGGPARASLSGRYPRPEREAFGSGCRVTSARRGVGVGRRASGVAAGGCRGRQPASRQGRLASTPRGRRDPDREAWT